MKGDRQFGLRLLKLCNQCIENCPIFNLVDHPATRFTFDDNAVNEQPFESKVARLVTCTLVVYGF